MSEGHESIVKYLGTLLSLRIEPPSSPKFGEGYMSDPLQLDYIAKFPSLDPKSLSLALMCTDLDVSMEPTKSKYSGYTHEQLHSNDSSLSCYKPPTPYLPMKISPQQAFFMINPELSEGFEFENIKRPNPKSIDQIFTPQLL